MTLVRIILIASVAVLAACGGSKDLTCDDERPYQTSVRAPRVDVPEDLDSLEPLREMPLPEPSPRPDRPEGSPCLDRPPTIVNTSS
jgi:uncharacterized lipoprotein